MHIYTYYTHVHTINNHRLWIKASISLTVVMGITWIIGFLVIEVEELFTLAYIFTIFVAFQGVFIFVIFVLLSKQVRENYAKWWKAKIAESDFLSKHFGSKILTSGTGVVSKLLKLNSKELAV
jgi:protein-S-isoprenylcysteine O-methyltransferase Ste14